MSEFGKRGPGGLGFSKPASVGSLVVVRSEGYHDYGTWSLEQKTVIGGMEVRKTVPPERMRRLHLDKRNWAQEVLRSVQGITRSSLTTASERQRKLVPIKALSGRTDAAAALKKIYDHELSQERVVGSSGDTGQHYARDKRYVLTHLADDIAKGKYGMVWDIWNSLTTPGDDSPDAWHTKTILGVNIRGLFLLLGSHERILAGIQGSSTPLWRKVELPQSYVELGVPIYHISSPYIDLLDLIRNREMLNLMPRKLPQPEKINALEVPEVKEELRDILWDTDRNQRYILYPEVLEAVPRNGGDIGRLHFLEAEGWFLSRAETPVGDFTTAIELDRASGFSSDCLVRSFGNPQDPRDILNASSLARFAADARRILLCARFETRSGNKRGKNGHAGVNGAGRHNGVEKGSMVLAQNVIYVDPDGISPRRREQGTPKWEVEPHSRRGHPRASGPISPDQRKKVREWMIEHRINRVPKPGPNETLVLPHFVPAGARFSQLPTYKREQLVEEAFGKKGISSREITEDWVGVEYFAD